MAKSLHQVICESITEALLKLMEEKDLDKITVKELTAKAGVGRVSFYRNFQSKEDVIIQYMVAEIRKWCLDRNLNTLYDWRIFFDILTSLKPTLVLLKKSNTSDLIYDVTNIVFTDIIFANEPYINEYTKSMYVGLFCGIAYQWLRDDFKYSLDELKAFVAHVNVLPIDHKKFNITDIRLRPYL